MSLSNQEMRVKFGVLIVFIECGQEVKFMGLGFINLYFFVSICCNWEEFLDFKCEENLELIIDGDSKEENGT